MTHSVVSRTFDEDLSTAARYWGYQLAGWLGYSAFGIAINLLNGAALGPLLVGHVVRRVQHRTHALSSRDIRRRRRDGRPFGSMLVFLAARILLIRDTEPLASAKPPTESVH